MITFINSISAEDIGSSIFSVDPHLFARSTTPLGHNDLVIINNSLATQVVGISEEDGIILKKISLDKTRGIKPVDIHQKAFLYYLEEKDIPLVTCLAPAGCGKTFLSLYVILELLYHRVYERAIIIKPLVTVGESKFLGTLPGDLDDKIAPFISSFYDVAYSLKSTKLLDELLDRGKITFEPIDFLRGRTLENTIVLCDEVQNLSNHQLLTLGTRIGLESKLIMIGDPKQSDTKGSVNINKFIENPHYLNSKHTSSIQLFKRMRSPITEVFENILG